MPVDALQARHIEIYGIVQGVGFRPFVYQLAHRLHLCGEVKNTAAGVTIHVEGPASTLEQFCDAIPRKAPPLAHITNTEVQPAGVKGCKRFVILKSRGAVSRETLISPDVAVCDDCLAELFDPNDRRFGYPFINCTNCGPRYTIIDDIPYDRPQTAMKRFRMCPACQAEYDDPLNRRFHAQPNACDDCGPAVRLCTADGLAVKKADSFAECVRLLKQGRILAIKGLGGFHLAADATNPDAVALLRQRKQREEKPLALMAPDLEAVQRFAHLSAENRALLTSPQRPIVLLPQRHSHPLALEVAPRNRFFGVMLPYTPLHHLLVRDRFTALVMTSGNISDEPICIDNADALNRLGSIADYFLLHNREIYLRSDDSILRFDAGDKRFIRRSRGYVPVPVFLRNKLPPVLACGAELKNTICLTKNDTAFVSQHIGDLENLETFRFLELTVAHLQRILSIAPRLITHDQHPDYLSTRYAESRTDLPAIAVQHHHAHIVSCMAENQIEGPVIGLAMDGTGYGSDGHIWGGEVLYCHYDRYQRLGHLRYTPMPGGTVAIKQPWRMGVSYLQQTFGEDFRDLELPFIQHLKPADVQTVARMSAQGFNAPLTSSLGRLFDGVAAICGLRQKVSFEGQAAMELEMAAGGQLSKPFDFIWQTAADGYQLDTTAIVKTVARQIQLGRPVAVISARFHATLIAMMAEICDNIRHDTGETRVALSGGVFQNTLLFGGLSRKLEQMGFRVFSHRRVPANDGGISLGQAVAAAAMSTT